MVRSFHQAQENELSQDGAYLIRQKNLKILNSGESTEVDLGQEGSNPSCLRASGGSTVQINLEIDLTTITRGR